MENKNMNKEFEEWLVQQKCYPFTNGWRLKQSLSNGFLGETNIKQIIIESHIYRVAHRAKI
jgi:hypothetical protein